MSTRNLLLGSVATALSLIGGYAGAAATAAPDESLTGVWRIEHPRLAIRTERGEEPPLTPAARKVYLERQAARRRGDLSFDSASWCAGMGLPRVQFVDYPFEIQVRPQYVAFLYEWNWWARVVYLPGALIGDGMTTAIGGGPRGGAVPAKALPGAMGLSLGHWEGATLVVKTDQIVDTTLLDSAGIPHSRQLALTEHIQLRGADVLEDRIRVEDPATFTQPWETVVTYRRQPGARIHEDVCLDRIKAGRSAVREASDER